MFSRFSSNSWMTTLQSRTHVIIVLFPKAVSHLVITSPFDWERLFEKVNSRGQKFLKSVN